MRIFDNPNHPHYGPVRRLWVVLMQLDLLEAAERWSDHAVETGAGWRWDEWLAQLMAENPHVKESAYQKRLLHTLIQRYG
jgi:hypothetical protein